MVEITDVKVKLVDGRRDKLQAYATVTLGGEFVIRDIKIIEGPTGAFMAMPSRKITDRCGRCGTKNHLRARHCNDCGAGLDPNRGLRDPRGRQKLHADVAHPINQQCRELLQQKILAAYEEEKRKAQEQGYTPPPDEDFIEDIEDTGVEGLEPMPGDAEEPLEEDTDYIPPIDEAPPGQGQEIEDLDEDDFLGRGERDFGGGEPGRRETEAAMRRADRDERGGPMLLPREMDGGREPRRHRSGGDRGRSGGGRDYGRGGGGPPRHGRGPGGGGGYGGGGGGGGGGGYGGGGGGYGGGRGGDRDRGRDRDRSGGRSGGRGGDRGRSGGGRGFGGGGRGGDRGRSGGGRDYGHPRPGYEPSAAPAPSAPPPPPPPPPEPESDDFGKGLD